MISLNYLDLIYNLNLYEYILLCSPCLIFILIYKNYQKKITLRYEEFLINKDMLDFSDYYKDRNDSHGIKHVIAVTKKALEFSKKLGLNYNEKKLVRKIGLLHDSYDHKYVTDNERLKRRINNDLRKQGCSEYEIKIIHMIIEDISFSKEKKERNKRNINKKIISFSDAKLQLIRDIVSDADKYEAIAEEAIDRMIQYSNENNLIKSNKYSNKWYEEHINNIRNHCNEKLFILVSDDYIRTDIGKNISRCKEMKLRILVSNDKLLYNKIKQY